MMKFSGGGCVTGRPAVWDSPRETVPLVCLSGIYQMVVSSPVILSPEIGLEGFLLPPQTPLSLTPGPATAWSGVAPGCPYMTS